MKYDISPYRKELICGSVVLLLLAGGICAGVWKQGEEPVYMLERPAWGEGETEKVLLVENEAGERQKIKVEIGERRYTEKEKEDFLKKAEEFIKKEALGENESWEKIQNNLSFIEELPEFSTEIYWDIGECECFDKQGKLLLDKVPKEGAKEKITAVLLCQGERRDVEISLEILPPMWTNSEIWRKEVEEKVQETEKQLSGTEDFPLPQWIGRQKAVYYEDVSGKTGGKEWLLFSVAAGGLLYAGLKREEKEKQERRRKQLLAEYPVLTEKLLLFMGAGVSIRNIFFKLCEEDKKKLYGKELKRACQELKNGEPEGMVYVRFGEKIGLLPYIRLGALLSQNLRSGTREIMDFLERERKESFYARKEQAKQRGEEIGVKLLLPMGILLFLTLAVIMVPAFLQF